MEKEILILGLSSGEHLIAQVIVTNEGSYLCSDVMQILSQPDEATGQMRMAFVSYLPFADPDGGVAIPTNMALLAVPSAELKNHYSERFGLIITPPPSKIIL